MPQGGVSHLDQSALNHGAQDLLVGHARLWRTLAVIEQLLIFVVAEDEAVLRVVEGEPFRDRFDGVGQALLARLQGGLLGRLARGDLAPGANHFHRLTVMVADQMLLIAHPAIGAVLLAEAILGDMAAVLEQLGLLGLDGGKVLGMDAGAPEVGILRGTRPGNSLERA